MKDIKKSTFLNHWSVKLFLIVLIILSLKWGAIIYIEYMQNIQSDKQNHISKAVDDTIPESEVVVWDLSSSYPKIEAEYQKMSKDIERLRLEAENEIEIKMLYQLDREDGYLDWLYGWGTGYKMIGHWIGGETGISQNAQEYLAESFNSIVIKESNPDLVIKKMQNRIRLRIEDYYRSILNIISKEISNLDATLKSKNMRAVLNINELPWGKYLAQGAIDLGGADIGITAVSVILMKLISNKAIAGSSLKIASLSVAKGSSIVATKSAISILGAKVVTIASSKVVVFVSSLGFGAIMDYLFNKGYEELNRKDERERYIEIIRKIAHQDYGRAMKRYTDTILQNLYEEMKTQSKKKIIIERSR